MLSVKEAKALLFSQVQRSPVVNVPIAEAYGHILAAGIAAPVDLPLFDASSVDGYVLNAENVSDFDSYRVIGEIKAGDEINLAPAPGEAVRIFTGAGVPSSGRIIVMQEYVTVENGRLNIADGHTPGTYLRKQGSQIKKGEPAVAEGSFLNPGTIGFLASMGISEVPVYQKPRISIIVTGNELVKPGEELLQGQIYESNSFALGAALQQMHMAAHVNIFHAEDEKEELDVVLHAALQVCDVLLLTGGISVGDYDFVHRSLQDAGAETIFYKVAQRPGKPLWTGRIREKMIFALPGNPASVMACFYEYTYPYIRMMCGYAEPFLQILNLPLLREVHEAGTRAAFLRAKIVNGGVMPLDKQDSGMMRSFSGGNALIYVPAERNFIAENEMAEVHLLPFEG